MTDLIQSLAIDDVESFEVCPGIVGRRLVHNDFVHAWAYDFEPGSLWPATDVHEAQEHYVVLEGEITDNGVTYPAGSYVVMLAGSSHRPGSAVGGRIFGISQTVVPEPGRTPTTAP